MRDFKLMDFYKTTIRKIPLTKFNELKGNNINPEHYKMIVKDINVDVLDIIKARLTEEEYRGFLKGNVLKYIFRADKKNGIEDYEKCEEYLKRLIGEIK